jgi:hypothetical protein
MPQATYRTLSEELLEYAEAFRKLFRGRGYKVSIEPEVLGAPFTATLRCARGVTTIYVDVVARLDLKRATAWWRFCRSCSSDTRHVIAYVEPLKPKGPPGSKDEEQLRSLGIGLWLCRSGGTIANRLPGQDLALGVELPTLGELPSQLRSILAAAYEQFEGSHWREGFREACDALEQEARKYLWKGIRQGRISLVTDKGNRRALTRAQVDRLTLGGLATAFSQIQAPNQRDALITKALRSVNPDRVLVAHHKGKRRAEERLRKNVGHQMYVVIQGLRQAVGLS